ncbi:MAG: ferritin family protein [Deltaproteobacteria bacterium]|jgi:rubrerythrin|nr:ferritin family protein [Deltaproteobacteria bacterium]
MSFTSFEEIVLFAMDKEKEAVDFYSGLAKNAVFSGARETLEGFAGEEQNHYDMLENLGKAENKLADYKFEWIPDIKRSNYLVDVDDPKDMDYADLLRLAMKREEKALKLYNELLEKADKEEFKNVFKMLCQEEAKHKLALETMYDDYMAEQGD